MEVRGQPPVSFLRSCPPCVFFILICLCCRVCVCVRAQVNVTHMCRGQRTAYGDCCPAAACVEGSVLFLPLCCVLQDSWPENVQVILSPPLTSPWESWGYVVTSHFTVGELGPRGHLHRRAGVTWSPLTSP